ncbi:MAG: hypothetical protein ACREOQ_22980, partial [Gemmatimonadales bacterium]
STGAILGTAGYLAPEQVQGGGVTEQADLYAAGITLYESLTGRRWHVVERPLEADWRGVPRDLASATVRALAFFPGERWPSAAAFRRALDTGRQRRRRAARWTIGGVAGTLGLVAAFWPSARRRAEAVDLSVAPFEAAPPGAAYLELSPFVWRRLQWFPEWSVAAPADSGGTRPPFARVSVGGAFEPGGGGVSLRLALRDSTGALIASPAVAGDTADLSGWSSRIADTIVALTFPRWADRYREMAARESGSLPAIREFLSGEDDFARDRWSDAERHYRRALDLDSNFLQAAWRLTVVRRWARVPFESDLNKLYADHRDDLPPLYRLLAEAQLTPDRRRRVQLYEAAVRTFPRSGYAGLLYADELFHRGPLIGLALDSSARLLDRGTAPGFDRALALDHALWAYIRLGRRNEAWTALRERLATAGPSIEESGEVNVPAFLRLAYVERFHSWMAPALRWWFLERGGSIPAGHIAKVLRLAALFDLPDAQLALGKIVSRRDSTSAVRAAVAEASGLALLMLGRPAAAMASLDTASALMATTTARLQALQWRVLPAALAWPGAAAPDEQDAPAALERLTGDSMVGNEAAWTLAVTASARGDSASARRWTARVARDTVSGNAATRRLALLVAMEQASLGRLRDAIALSEPAIAFDSAGRIGGAFLRSAAHLARGRWWLALGEPSSADAEWLWYENSDFVGWPRAEAQAAEVDAVFSVAARRLRASLALAHGDRRFGCREFERVAELWRGADVQFQRWARAADSLSRSCGA